MPELKIGVQLNSLRLPFRRGLDTASRMGVTAIELDARSHVRPREMTDTALRSLKKMLADANLKVCALSLQTRGGYNSLERLQERIEATKATMDLAYKLGASVVVNQIGRVPEEQSGEDWDLLVDVLTELGKYAQRAGAFLAAETGTESAATLSQLLTALPEGSLGVTLNPGKLIVNGFSASEAVSTLGPHVMYVHAQDGVRDLAQGRGIEVPLGRGSVDFAEQIGQLEEHGYGGYFCVAREQATHPVDEVAMAVKYLQAI